LLAAGCWLYAEEFLVMVGLCIVIAIFLAFCLAGLLCFRNGLPVNPMRRATELIEIQKEIWRKK